MFPAFIAGLNCGALTFGKLMDMWGVFPAFIAGLNCGWPLALPLAPVLRCSRRSSPGSIAAARSSWTGCPRRQVFPAFIAGLNCGYREEKAFTA